MSDVELICEKSFSEIDSEIINRFVEFQQAIIDKDEDKLDEMLSDDYVLVHMSGKMQSKRVTQSGFTLQNIDIFSNIDFSRGSLQRRTMTLGLMPMP